MSDVIRFRIDGNECLAEHGKFIVDAAKENNIYIPTLCNVPGLKPRGSCRICTVKVNGRLMTACTTPVAENMEIESDTAELRDLRKAIVELMFADGNHFCPACEKSGDCELQALGYRFRMDVSRYPYQFPYRQVEAFNPKLMKDHNRCILCKRCIRGIKDEKGRSLFAFKRRSRTLEISIDRALADSITDELAQKAMDICPVGALLKRGRGFVTPIGKHTYDNNPIGKDLLK